MSRFSFVSVISFVTVLHRKWYAGNWNFICSNVKGSGGVPFTQLELLEATHRGLHKFVPRHHDEIDLEIGDPIYVQKEADDLWCEGSNIHETSARCLVDAFAFFLPLLYVRNTVLAIVQRRATLRFKLTKNVNNYHSVNNNRYTMMHLCLH